MTQGIIPRDAKDYAIEFGEYLATAAESYMSAADVRISTKIGVGEQEALAERFVALRSAIYEFRKRAERAK